MACQKHWQFEASDFAGVTLLRSGYVCYACVGRHLVNEEENYPKIIDGTFLSTQWFDCHILQFNSLSKNQYIRITHKPSGEVMAEGEKGWGMFAFEGNYYISDRNLKTDGFKSSWIPGICFYKFIYIWYHFTSADGHKSPMIAWKYWLPNPLFPFIAFRIAVPRRHPDLLVEVV